MTTRKQLARKRSKKIETRKKPRTRKDNVEIIYPQLDKEKARRHIVRRAPVIDVSVTQHHINTAKPKDSGHCMIADAIKELVPGAKHVSVDLQTCRFSDPDKGLRYVWLTPTVAQWSLIDWDEGVPIQPFRFRLKRPAQIVTMHRGPQGKQKPVHRHLSREHRPRAISSPGEARNKTVPTLVGGRTLPRSRKGRRREFGLRAFKTRQDVLISGRA